MNTLSARDQAAERRNRIVRKPNFFILGAPKCGTTAMHEYLCQHPQVFMSRVKEPHYFCLDFPEYRAIHTQAEYEALFGRASDELIVGESSVFYLYSATAVPAALAYAPDAKFLVMLRNPLDMLPSLHAQLLYGFREDEKDFSAAWRLQEVRAQGLRLPPGCRAPQHLQYAEVARFASQLRRLYDHVDRSQVHVLLFDDFARDARAEFEKVLQFLELPPCGNIAFDRVNQHKVHRWPAVSRLLMRPPALLMRLKQSLKKKAGLHETALSKLLYRTLSARGKWSPLSIEMQHALVNRLRADVEDLQRLLDRDLSHWGFFRNGQ